MPPTPIRYDAFISFKHSGRDGGITHDAEAARAVYEALVSAGVRTFFSPECLKHHGQGKFSKSIEAALDSARFLVLVASCREHVESRWVETEWDTFIHDVRSGHKPDGDLVIFNCGDLTPNNLPLFLRRHSMFGHKEMDALVQVVRNACEKPPGLKDVIRASLHCHHPEQNKDKIYLITAHSPGGSEYIIKTHWGPRDAKRLASMVKKSGLTSESEIKTTVKAIVREKTQGKEGYQRKPWRSLLTVAAMTAMAAELAVEPPNGRASRATAARTAKGMSKKSASPRKRSAVRGNLSNKNRRT